MIVAGEGPSLSLTSTASKKASRKSGVHARTGARGIDAHSWGGFRVIYRWCVSSAYRFTATSQASVALQVRGVPKDSAQS